MIEADGSDAFPPGFDLATLARRELTRFRGREVVVAHDCVLATFDGPARAVRCAAAIITVLRAQGTGARAGLHTGEMELVERGGTGIPVRVASELAARAELHEILVTSTVKDLVAGSGLQFEGRGAHVLTDRLDAWHLFKVDHTSLT